MPSLVSAFLERLFPNAEHRGLLFGLDASGRTTWLYQAKLGEVVTTIPTIGFNVETLQHGNKKFTLWDVGGCDKIRPLWRHYFQNMDLLLFFVDSNDRDRMPEARDELHRILNEQEVREYMKGLLVVANKQDLPNAMSVQEVTETLRLEEGGRGQPWAWTCMPGSMRGDELLATHLNWLSDTVARPRGAAPRAAAEMGGGGGGSSGAAATKPGVGGGVVEAEKDDILTRWLAVEDEPDDEFIAALEGCTLDNWDHRTHLRLAFLYLTRHGRREGLSLIFSSIKRFIDVSPVTKRKTGTTFHETMTYFWAHMVHFALASTQPLGGMPLDFKTFLVLNPVLSNGGLFLHYYSKQLMLMDPRSRTEVVLPDKRPLPSIITDVAQLAKLKNLSTGTAPAPPPPKDGGGAASSTHQPTDREFMERFLGRSLDRWNHECLLRTLYCYLKYNGRRNGVREAMAALQAFQKDGFHTTITYFWIQMLTYILAHDYSATLLAADPPSSSAKGEDGAAGANCRSSSAAVGPSGRAAPADGLPCLPEWHVLLDEVGYTSEKLRGLLLDERMYLAHYSKQIIYSDEAAAQFVVPDKKPLPSTLR